MDIIRVAEIVKRQLEQQDIKNGDIYVLEKKWGYVVQIGYGINGMKKSNIVFNKEGNVIHPLSEFLSDSGEVYHTERREAIFGNRIRTQKLAYSKTPKVQYVELDEQHFMIPTLGEFGAGNALFFVDENNKARYKGNIEGKIVGDVITKNEDLIARKQVLTEVEIDRTKDRFEKFFYSWNENCRVSDKWSELIAPNDIGQARETLRKVIGISDEEGGNIIQNIIDCMALNQTWLAVLSLYTPNNYFNRNYVCLVGNDGKPKLDLMYIEPELCEMVPIPLKKDRIGEVDKLKEFLQERMDREDQKREEKKKNYSNVFFAGSDLLVGNRQERLEDGEKGIR